MIEYPKTYNLHRRDERGRMIDVLQMPEVASVAHWQAHEKIDGTSCRLDFRVVNGAQVIDFGGRTDRAQLHKDLHQLLYDTTFRASGPIFEKIEEHGVDSLTVFVEGIGPKIQGNIYGLTVHKLVAFDVLVDDRTWLPQSAVDEYAELLGIWRAPLFCDEVRVSLNELAEHEGLGWLTDLPVEQTGTFTPQREGLILRPLHELRTQRGERVKIKIKNRDYRALT